MSDVEEEVGGEEADVINAPDDTYGDDDEDAIGAQEGAGSYEETAQADAEEDEYKEDAEEDDYKVDPEPEPEPEPAAKAQAEPDDEETSYQDDFEQSIVPKKEEDRYDEPVDEPVDDGDGSVKGGSGSRPGSAALAKSASGTSRVSSAAGARPGSSSSATPAPAPAKPAAAASKAAVAAAATPTKPAPKPAPKPDAVSPPKPSLPPPKPAVPRAPAVSKPAPKAPPPPPPPPVSIKPAIPPRNIVSNAPPPAPPPVAIGPGGQKVKLTFTKPPNTARAAPSVKPDYSHSSYEVKKITSDNMKLCNRLVEISRSPPNPSYTNTLSVGTAAVTGKLAPANVAASSVNRHKKEDKIAQENLALYKRLQTAKPTPGVNRQALNKDFAKAQAYGDNARKVRPAAPPPVAVNLSAAKLAASGMARQPVAGSAEAIYMNPPRQAMGGPGSGGAGGSLRGQGSGGGSGGGSFRSPGLMGPGSGGGSMHGPGSGGGSFKGSGSGAAPSTPPGPFLPPIAGADLSTVAEGQEGETSSAWGGAGGAGAGLEPEYSMDPDFDPSQSIMS